MDRPIPPWMLTSLLLFAIGCAGRTARGPTRIEGRLVIEAAAPATSERDARPPACKPGVLATANHGVAVDLECTDGHRRCSGRLPIAVRGCRAQPLAVREIRVYDAGSSRGTVISFDPLRPLGAGALFEYRLHVMRAREYDVEVDLVELDGTPLAPLALSATVRNPHREEAQRRCRECNGDWGHHGIMQLEGCLCRAPDAGQECRDGRDCFGLCLFERFEVTQPGQPLRCEAEHCSYVEERGVLVGRCSEFVTMFGCHSFLPDDISQRGPIRAGYPAPHVCID